MARANQNIYSKFFALKAFFKVTLFSFLLLACVPSKNQSNIKPKPIDKLNASGFAKDLEKALDHLQADTSTKKLFPSKACPDKIINTLPDYAIADVECGAVKVPVNHDKDLEESFSLGYFKYPQNFDKKKPLLIIEQGGPGGSSMSLAARYLAIIDMSKEGFNILAVEQRGTLWTRPNLQCNAVIEEIISGLQKGESSSFESEAVIKANQKCLSENKSKVQIANVSTYQIAKDKVVAASLFGYEKFHFYGVSYGTLVGQYLLKYSPESLLKTVLDSGMLPNQSWMNEVVLNLDSLILKNLEQFVASSPDYDSIAEVIARINHLANFFDEIGYKIPWEFDDVYKADVRISKEIYRNLVVSMLVAYYDQSILSGLLRATEDDASGVESVV